MTLNIKMQAMKVVGQTSVQCTQTSLAELKCYKARSQLQTSSPFPYIEEYYIGNIW